MARLTLIDGLCRSCKHIIRREDVSDVAPSSAEAIKKEIEGQGLYAAHYTADSGSVKTQHLAHKMNCKTLQPPALENKGTEVMAAALGVESKATKAKKQAAKKRRISKAKK